MAQHDFIIENQARTAFRQDVNSALAALVSNNSGSAPPSTTYAYQFWADTGNGLLKQRNSANSAWVTLGSLDQLNLGLAALASPAFTGTPTAPTATTGASSTQLATTQFVGNTAASIAGARNLLINANPTINQRGWASGAASSYSYQTTLDRWQIVTTGQAVSWTDSNNIRTVTAPSGGLRQVIEGSSIIQGSYVLFWTGSATATVLGSAVSKGVPFTLNAGSDVPVIFSNGTFALPQLERGSISTPFEVRSPALEQMLCERYYQIVERVVVVRQTSLSAFFGGIAPFTFATRMRSAPTLAYSDFISGTYNNPAFYIAARGGTINFAGGSTVGDYAIYNLAFEAEL